jgi:hypothetical protein
MVTIDPPREPEKVKASVWAWNSYNALTIWELTPKGF